ncbi:hypothetical protein E7744_11330 [Citricoccus sp. SGAir0253]|uniref:hypothetical protein n=1 Tax=Citricoccus sp. SGAir0253 TaxID=2567881 RepID=UPI0010CD4936|nr:hypothetical protein [Citricoccus sp. SGAir0253]QCU78672.1 hypothetical protein E7744_11330 [Citricoccus sp. SGAir0253]
MKAKLFINRSMDNDPRSFDERAMWATLALELLAKAALSNQSPVLIADPNDDASLLGASGLVSAESSFKSVRATTVYRRCKRAFRPFDEKKAEKFAVARNEYLHGGGVAFSAIPEDIWWADFWSLAAPLVDALDKEVEDIVGVQRAEMVRRHLQNNRTYLAERVESLLSRAKARYEDRRSGRISTARSKQWKSAHEISAGLRYSTDEICPACAEWGLLEAEEVENMRIEHWGDPMEGFGYRGVADAMADYFACEHCQLVLNDYELLEAAGIDPTFEVEGEEFVEHLMTESEYGNE